MASWGCKIWSILISAITSSLEPFHRCCPMNLHSARLFSPSLQYLNFSNNQFVGSLLDYQASSFENLRVLDVSNNQLPGKLTTFEFSYGLETLRLGGNRFSGNFPDALFVDNTLALKELDLIHNSLSVKHN